MMQSSQDDKDLKKFLEKVDNLESLVKGMTSDDPKTQQDAILKADRQLEKWNSSPKDDTGFSRTVINKDAYKNEEDLSASTPFQSPETSQDAFLTALENDAKKRTQARIERHKKANVVKEKGNVCFKNGEYKDAVNFYSEAITIAKDHTCLYTNRAAAHIKLEEYEDAIKDCDTALIIDEKWFKAFIFKTRALQKLQKFDDAIEVIKCVLQFDEGKQKLVDGLVKEIENDRLVLKSETAAKEFLEAADPEARGIAKVIAALRTRQELEKEAGSYGSASLMFYAGGFRVLQSHFKDDQSKTLFRTQGGFKLFSECGPVRQTLMCKVGKDGVSAKTPCHGLELVSACIGLFTAICMQNPENLKTLLSIETIPEAIQSLFKWPNDELKRDAILFFHEASLNEETRRILYSSFDCAILAFLICYPSTSRADAHSAANATLCNMTLDQRFRKAMVKDFAASYLPIFRHFLPEIGKKSYEALTLRMKALYQLCQEQKILLCIANDELITCGLTDSFKQCITSIKQGNGNPCAMSELLDVMIEVIKSGCTADQYRIDMTGLTKTTLQICTNREIQLKILHLLSVVLSSSSTCITFFIKENKQTILKQLFKFIKQADERFKTYALKIFCILGQHDGTLMKVFLNMDKDYKILRKLIEEENKAEACAINLSHVALIIGMLCFIPGGLEPFVKVDYCGSLVRRLLNLCRDSKNKHCRANCAVALGKLAKSDQRFLVELRNHDGINILARHKPPEELLN